MRRKCERGVSPVIATILMVAITVVLAAVLYVMVTRIIDPDVERKPSVILGNLSCDAEACEARVTTANPATDLGAFRVTVSADGETVIPPTTLAAGVNVIATPGHTPGHAGVVLSSGGERAFILGDAISCPVQLEETEWSGMGDMDPKLARRTQEAVAREAESSGALLATSHFPDLTFGRVLRGEGRRYWQPL